MLLSKVDGLDKQLSQGSRESVKSYLKWENIQKLYPPVEHKLDLLPQLLRLELDGILLEDRVSGLEDSVDHVEVAGGELGHQVRDEVLPVHGEVLLADDGDGLAQLLLHWTGRLQHQVHDQCFHLQVGELRIQNDQVVNTSPNSL